MLHTVIHYGLDIWAFAAIGAGAAAGLHLWLKRRDRGGLTPSVHACTLAVIALAALVTNVSGRLERDRLRSQLLGFAPTYAAELALMGHAGVTESTPVDDATYLKMIAAEKRWLASNPAVSDIYTFRKDQSGAIRFVVDSETDYDRNGRYEGDRESRTAIGEKYARPLPGWYAALDGVPSFDEQPQTDRWGTWVSAYVPIRDASGRVEAAVGVDYDAAKWLSAIQWHRLAALGLSAVVLTITLSAAVVVAIGRAELTKRERLQRQLVDASRQAGMAEVATGVLHNAGNVLNNVTVSTEVLADALRNSKLTGLTRAVELLRSHDADLVDFLTNDPKGRLLPGYLSQLSDVLVAERAGAMEELADLGRSLAHVKQIMASQQSLAKTVHVIETFDVDELLADAKRLGVPAEERGRVAVEVAPTTVPQVTSDRHQILQILTNLITNAVQATAGSVTRRVELSVSHAVITGGGAIGFRVSDTGCGMTAETLANLFTHGFTTRPDGHGFGLHHASIAAGQLGGTLVAHSDGPGRGATFTLTVPADTAEAKAAA